MTIYFIRAENEGSIKIGFTAGSAERRMAQLQTGQPLRLQLIGTIPGEMEAERGLHKEFSAHRLGGEWFKPARELLDAMTHLIDGQLPWYFCREGAILTKRMEYAWGAAFDDASADISAHDAPESGRNVESAIRALLAFDKDLARVQRYKKEHGRAPAWRDDIMTKYVAFKNRPEFRAARYNLAWQALELVRTGDREPG